MGFVVCSWSSTFNLVYVLLMCWLFSQGATGKKGARGLTGSPGGEVRIHTSPTAVVEPQGLKDESSGM